MKKKHFKILAIALLAFSIKANVQCNACTKASSGSDASNYIVSAGQKFCITATGNIIRIRKFVIS